MRGIACLFLAGVVLCQTRPANVESVGPNLPAQKIGPNDLVAVSVYDQPEFSRTARVSAEGYIRLPLLSRRIQAEGLLPAELETVIAEALRAEEILVDPVVTVTIAEYHSRPINVAGAVKNPTTFQALGGVTLLDAITRAGGLRPDAGLEILVTKSQLSEAGKPTALTQRIPVKGLIDTADPELNIRLYGGEEIRVPEIGKIFVVGNVKKPGAFPMQDTSETTVLQMLALAEGVAPYAGKTAYIYRREGLRSKNEIPIELRKLLDRKSPDVPLVANDILYIPDNRGRRASMTVLERFISFGVGTASGVLVYSSIR
ncbi:MAG: polysaccharide biosynthesis/export family protein [Acidobacteria bacterium]|nr:polysaccharide biosynthesis/export family protein [Acidobacteriota bacterium]